MLVQEVEEVSTYLTFRLGEEIFALDVANVKEVLDLAEVTRIPRTPNYMKGVINLRGGVVPVVDMRIKYGLPVTESTVDTCIIVTEVELDGDLTVIGALADSVREVLQIKSDQIEPPPRIGMRVSSDFIQGIGKLGEKFVIILDIKKTFTGDEFLHLQSAEGSPVPSGKSSEAEEANAVT